MHSSSRFERRRHFVMKNDHLPRQARDKRKTGSKSLSAM
jgi:hypothetical protein